MNGVMKVNMYHICAYKKKMMMMKKRKKKKKMNMRDVKEQFSEATVSVGK